MNIENYIFDALEIVSTWELPEEELADAVMDQAALMMGASIYDIRECHSDNH